MYDLNKTKEASSFVESHCPSLGSYSGDSAPYRFLAQLAEDMVDADPSDLFPDRYKEHVAFAVDLVSKYDFLNPPAAVAAVYLVTRFEYYFRLLSGLLNADGTWKNRAVDQPNAVAALGSDRGLRSNRVSDVAISYRLVLMNRGSQVAKTFRDLDDVIFQKPYRATGGIPVASIGDRIAFGRHSTGHGPVADISSEAVFYGLITAMVFYGQP